jgi:GNAT superfamily N-acetyltransferase
MFPAQANRSIPMPEIVIRAYQDENLPVLVNVIRRNLVEINSKDYPPEIITFMVHHYSATELQQLTQQRDFYVAEIDHTPIGTIALDHDVIYTLFVDTRYHRHGIGQQLVRHVEAVARAQGLAYIKVGASITAHQFYAKLGYQDLHETSNPGYGKNYMMGKAL